MTEATIRRSRRDAIEAGRLARAEAFRTAWTWLIPTAFR